MKRKGNYRARAIFCSAIYIAILISYTYVYVQLEWNVYNTAHDFITMLQLHLPDHG